MAARLRKHIQCRMCTCIHGHTHTLTHRHYSEHWTLYNLVLQCFWYLVAAWLTVEYWASVTDMTSSPGTAEETAEHWYSAAACCTQNMWDWKSIIQTKDQLQWLPWIGAHIWGAQCTVWCYSFMLWPVIISVTTTEPVHSKEDRC